MRRHRNVRRGGRRLDGLRCRRKRHRLRHRRGTNRAQVAFDHGKPIDDVAERRVNGFERILGLAVGLRLAEADVGELSLDEIDQAVVLVRLAALLAARERDEGRMLVVGKGSKRRVLVFEMAQDVLQPVLTRPRLPER